MKSELFTYKNSFPKLFVNPLTTEVTKPFAFGSG